MGREDRYVGPPFVAVGRGIIAWNLGFRRRVRTPWSTARVLRETVWSETLACILPPHTEKVWYAYDTACGGCSLTHWLQKWCRYVAATVAATVAAASKRVCVCRGLQTLLLSIFGQSILLLRRVHRCPLWPCPRPRSSPLHPPTLAPPARSIYCYFPEQGSRGQGQASSRRAHEPGGRARRLLRKGSREEAPPAIFRRGRGRRKAPAGVRTAAAAPRRGRRRRRKGRGGGWLAGPPGNSGKWR